jgi:hypothetical protein
MKSFIYKFSLLFTVIFILNCTLTSYAQIDPDDPGVKMYDAFLTQNFLPLSDENIGYGDVKNYNFIPVIINNATGYGLVFDSMNVESSNRVYFPLKIDSHSTETAFIYNNIFSIGTVKESKVKDLWARYKFNNTYNTQFVFHTLRESDRLIKKQTVFNGIQASLRVSQTLLRIVKFLYPGPTVKIILTIVNCGISAVNIGITIAKLLSSAHIYFLAYPYSHSKQYTEVPTKMWYKDTSGIESSNSVFITGAMPDDTAFVTENYVVWASDSLNFPKFQDTTKYTGYILPKIVVNIYPRYLYSLSSVSVNAEQLKNGAQYNDNPKIKKLVDKILETDCIELDKIYSEVGYNTADKTSALFYECFSDSPPVLSSEIDSRIDELLKSYKIE